MRCGVINHNQQFSSLYTQTQTQIKGLICMYAGLCSMWFLLKQSFLCHSVHWPLADVLLDREFQNPRAVHGGLWPVRLLAVHPWSHCAAGLDAPRSHCHHAQSPGVDIHGRFHRAGFIAVKHQATQRSGRLISSPLLQPFDCLELEWNVLLSLNG